MTKKTLITLLQYVVFLGFGIAIIFYMLGKLTEEEKDQMLASMAGVRLWLIIPTLIVGFLAHYFRSLRWKLLLEPLNIYPSTTNVTLAVLIGYIVNLVLPRAGEVAKCTVLARYEKVPADKMVGTIVSERAFDLVCLLIVTIIAFTSQAHIIGDYADDLFLKIAAKRNVFIIVICAIVGIIITLVLLYRRLKESRVGRFIKGLGAGVSSILHMKKRWQFIGYTFLIWSMYLSLVVIGFKCLPATEHLDILAALVVLVFGSIGMITTQGGIGAYTYLVAKILLFYNIPDAEGQAFGWISWLAQTAIVLVLGIGSFIILPIYNRNRTPHGQNALDSK